MRPKVIAVSISMVISLMALPSAHATALPVIIHCSASGSGLFYTENGFDLPDTWTDIAATGVCAAKDSGKPFTVTLSGAGQDDELVCCADLAVDFSLDATLTNIQNGHSKTYVQNWTSIGGLKWIVQSSRISLGYGTVKFGPAVSINTRQYLHFAWTFLVFSAP